MIVIQEGEKKGSQAYSTLKRTHKKKKKNNMKAQFRVSVIRNKIISFENRCKERKDYESISFLCCNKVFDQAPTDNNFVVRNNYIVNLRLTYYKNAVYMQYKRFQKNKTVTEKHVSSIFNETKTEQNKQHSNF